jgi:hypothetical protein
MFAPKVAKPQTKAAESSTNSLAYNRSTLVAHRSCHDGPGGHQETAVDLDAHTAPGLSWSFNKIPLFPPDRMSGSHTPSPLSAPLMPAIIQPKLVVGRIDDPLEHEADRVADQVMRMPAPEISSAAGPSSLSRKCAACEDEEAKTLQTKSAADGVPSIVHEVLRSSGQPLDAEARSFFEPRFGHDFSHVRVHADEHASVSARSVDARAYTLGTHVVFGTNQYALGMSEGRRLLAHELAHVIQQGFVPMEPGPSHKMRQNPCGIGTNQGALLTQLTPLLLQRAPAAGPAAKVQVKDDQPRHAAIDIRDRAPVPPVRTREKILNFNEHNSDLGADVLSKIQSGILMVTDKANTPEVAYSFFDFYSHHTLRQMTADEEKTENRRAKRLLVTSTEGFTTTIFQSVVLSYNAVKLANLLLHELAHTGDIAGSLAGEGAYQEGHAYAIEYFYAEIAGDMNRANDIQGLVADGYVLGLKKADGQAEFKVTYALMTALREVATNGSSSHLPFPELTPASAKALEEQVVTSFRSPSKDLGKYIDYVKANLGSFKIPKVD